MSNRTVEWGWGNGREEDTVALHKMRWLSFYFFHRECYLTGRSDKCKAKLRVRKGWWRRRSLGLALLRRKYSFLSVWGLWMRRRMQEMMFPIGSASMVTQSSTETLSLSQSVLCTQTPIHSVSVSIYEAFLLVQFLFSFCILELQSIKTDNWDMCSQQLAVFSRNMPITICNLIMFFSSLICAWSLPNFCCSIDRVFGCDSSTRKVYEGGAKEVALSVVNGINGEYDACFLNLFQLFVFRETHIGWNL